MLKPYCHLFHVVTFVAGMVCCLCKVDIETFWWLGVVPIIAAKGANTFQIVNNCMKLRYVEIFSDFEINEDLFMFVKCFQAFFKFSKGFWGVELELRIINEVEKSPSNGKHFSIYCPSVKLGVQTEMSGPKSCEALASTCRLRRSLAGCLEFRSSGRSRRVRNRAEKKLKEDESELRRSRLLSWYSN